MQYCPHGAPSIPYTMGECSKVCVTKGGDWQMRTGWFRRKPKHEHAWSKWVPKQTEDGYAVQVRQCAECGYTQAEMVRG